MNQCSSCSIFEPAPQNAISERILDGFEAENYTNLPKNEEFCTSCQIIRPPRSKHCRFMDSCVQEYDHYCFFLNKPIGKDNRKVFLFGLLMNYTAVFLFLFLTWLKIHNSIEDLEHIFTYCVNLCIKYWEFDGVFKIFIAVSVIVWWHNLGYLFLESFSISNALTMNEVLNRHRYRYLYTPCLAADDSIKMKFKNPFTKGFIQNWLDFIIN